MSARPDRHLPRLILIADGFTRDEVMSRAVAAVEAGVPWLHLRDHAAGDGAFRDAALKLAQEVRAVSAGVLVSANGRLEVAEEFGLGLHTGVHGPDIKEAVRRLATIFPVGYSAHGAAEARAALEAGADYVFVSPVFATSSKPGQEGIGVAGLRRTVEDVPGARVFALGGITPERVGECTTAGAYGVAVLSGILEADDVAGEVRAYLEALAVHTGGEQ